MVAGQCSEETVVVGSEEGLLEKIGKSGFVRRGSDEEVRKKGFVRIRSEPFQVDGKLRHGCPGIESIAILTFM